MSSTQQAESQGSAPKANANFEFLKRKKWAELVVSDVVNAVFLVLTLTGTVLYCGSSVAEVSGWQDTDLVDRNLLRFFHEKDQQGVADVLERCLQTDREEIVCAHLMTNGSSHKTAPKEIYGELRVYPHTYPDDNGEAKVLFASFTPTPSRSGQLFNTTLDLLTEQIRLKTLVAAAAARLPPEPTPSGPSPPSNPIYATSNLDSTRAASGSHGPLTTQRNESLGPYLTTSSLGATRGPDVESVEVGETQNPDATLRNGGEDIEDGPRKKKQKRTQAGEQHICTLCGRTDSPEWRKGPAGPKTLCNACGLRWAKQNRKPTDDHSVDVSEPSLLYPTSATPPPP